MKFLLQEARGLAQAEGWKAPGSVGREEAAVAFSGVLGIMLSSLRVSPLSRVSSLDLLEHLLSVPGLSERDRLLGSLVLVPPGGGEEEGFVQVMEKIVI